MYVWFRGSSKPICVGEKGEPNIQDDIDSGISKASNSSSFSSILCHAPYIDHFFFVINEQSICTSRIAIVAHNVESIIMAEMDIYICCCRAQELIAYSIILIIFNLSSAYERKQVNPKRQQKIDLKFGSIPFFKFISISSLSKHALLQDLVFIFHFFSLGQQEVHGIKPQLDTCVRYIFNPPVEYIIITSALIIHNWLIEDTDQTH